MADHLIYVIFIPIADQSYSREENLQFDPQLHHDCFIDLLRLSIFCVKRMRDRQSLKVKNWAVFEIKDF